LTGKGVVSKVILVKQKISFEIVELEEKTFHPLIRAEFEGLESHWWVIDTGASKSVFDESLIGYYTGDNEDSVMATGLGKEVVHTNSATISKLNLGGYNFGALKVALVDFLHINNEYAKFSDKKIVGLIGCDFLYPHKAILDFDKREIFLIAD
jgi:hypothetical protein